MENIFKKNVSVRAVDVDFQGKIRAEMFLAMLMEAASEHAARLGVGVLDMFKKNLTWVLSRWHVRILRYPSMWQEFDLVTWPSFREGTYTLREFEAFESGGDQLAQATTSWLALDLGTKKPVQISRVLPDFSLENRRALADDFPPLPKLQTADMEREYPVLRTYLDVNRHVTSTIYILWALETVPEDVLLKLRPSEIEINYRRETFFSDRVLVRTQRSAAQDKPTFVHQLLRAGDGKELAVLRTAWADI